MGLRRESIYLLMQEGLKRPFSGRVLTLGKQDIWTDYNDVKKLAQKLNFPLKPILNIELSEKAHLREQGYISDRTLFSLLGFDEIISTDASNYEKADILFDLNEENLPENLKEAFDLIIDPGTIEHVFHVPNSLKNIFKMVKIGGRVIHISPSSNHLDHGFYMFSPTLFWDYYSANCFDINQFKLIRYKPQWVFPWKIASYLPGMFNSVSFGGLDNGMYAVYCIVTKTDSSSCHKIPQQYNFVQNLWKQKEFFLEVSRIKEWLKKVPILYRMFLPLAKLYKKRKLNQRFETLL